MQLSAVFFSACHHSVPPFRITPSHFQICSTPSRSLNLCRVPFSGKDFRHATRVQTFRLLLAPGAIRRPELRPAELTDHRVLQRLVARLRVEPAVERHLLRVILARDGIRGCARQRARNDLLLPALVRLTR